MKIKFLGAVGTVTGSATLIEHTASNVRFLVDCGMSQGEPDSHAANVAPWPFVESRLDFVLLTHAHLDHCGLLPRLVREGFTGPVYCTRFTAKLARINLLDAVRQSPDVGAEIDVNRIRFTYVDEQRGFAFGQPIPLGKNLQAVFSPGAHIGGACSIAIQWRKDEERWREIVFSGDLGPNAGQNAPQPLLAPRQPWPTTPDYMVVESTYGARVRAPSLASATARMADWAQVITESIERARATNVATISPPCVVIPCFSIHRAQELLVDLHALLDRTLRDQIVSVEPVYSNDAEIESALARGVSRRLIDGPQNILTQMPPADEALFHDLFHQLEVERPGKTPAVAYVLKTQSAERIAQARELLRRAARPKLNISILVLLDSPMGRRATSVYQKELTRPHPDDPQRRMYRNPGLVEHLGVTSEVEVDTIIRRIFSATTAGETAPVSQRFMTYTLTFCDPWETDEILAAHRESPALTIVLSGSGMGDVGPVTAHLERELPRMESTVVLTGYAPPSSVAGRLRSLLRTGSSGPEKVLQLPSLDLADSQIRAQIADVGGYYSGHADQSGLLDFVFGMPDSATPMSPGTTVLVNHGNDEVREAFRTEILTRAAEQREGDRLIHAVVVPGKDRRWFDLDTGTWLHAMPEAAEDRHEQLLLRLYTEQRRTNDLLAELLQRVR